MTLYDEHGNELSSAAAVNPSGTAVRQSLDEAVKKLTEPLTLLCEQIAHPRLKALGVPRWTARCWCHRRASSKDPQPMLIVHCRVTAGADVDGKAVDITEQHHAAFALRELGKEDGGSRLAAMSVELVGLVVARAVMRLVDAGAVPPQPEAEPPAPIATEQEG